MNRNYHTLAQFYLLEGVVKIVQDTITNQYYRIETTSTEVKIKKIDEKDVLDCILANNAYKNDQYNLSDYPRIDDLFK